MSMVWTFMINSLSTLQLVEKNLSLQVNVDRSVLGWALALATFKCFTLKFLKQLFIWEF